MIENNKNKVGIISGKFRLLHQGHIEYFNNVVAMEDIDELLIICTRDKESKFYSTKEELENVISMYFRKYHMPYHIVTVDIKDMEVFNDLNIWENMVIKKYEEVLQRPFHKEDAVIFNSKEDYPNNLLENRFVKVKASRETSVTNIEKDLVKNSYYIYPLFRRFVNKKVVISGVESSGKTTLSNMLADRYSTTVSYEFGRVIGDETLGNSQYFTPDFPPKVFAQIVAGQMHSDIEANKEAQGYLFVDTDPIVTLRFLDFYNQVYGWDSDINYKEQYKLARNVLVAQCRSYTADIVILLEPAKFVDDGVRDVLSAEERNYNFEQLLKYYQTYAPQLTVKSVEFTGDYQKRYHQVSKIIDEL